jgi:hypothetical protein
MVKNINTCFVTLAIMLAFTANSIAETTGKKTMWKVVDQSLTDLLNSGWKLIGQNSERVATSPGASGYRTYDERSFVYTLYKNGKYITCFVIEPRPDDGYSHCRLIN